MFALHFTSYNTMLLGLPSLKCHTCTQTLTDIKKVYETKVNTQIFLYDEGQSHSQKCGL
jgi:hypothetical protein